jgi:hypothetical protein
MREQVIDDASQLVGSGDDGRLGAESGPQALVEGCQAVVAATDRLGREPQCLSGAVAGLQRASAPHPPARDLLAWREPQPRTERLRVGPFLHIQADFREKGLHRVGVQARHRHQVHDILDACAE